MEALPPGWRLRFEETLPSTSDLLLRLAAAGEPEGLAVMARRQTGGRGRDGRVWESPAGNLYISLLLRPGTPARDAARWSLAGAIAMAEAVEPDLPDPAALRVKWPNDLLLDGAKLAGVLCESGATPGGRLDWVILGCGINLAVAPEVPGRATTRLPGDAPPEQVAVRLIRSVVSWRDRPMPDLIAAWLRRGPALGERLTLRTGTGETTGSFAGLAEDGALLLDTGAGPRRFGSGEVDGA
ncbi:biotin--[acetyl-CoA-carboxylase] ligase [Falsiroseomonas sp. HW251]|uniref:biotin--[acetyl-CoA-carboxylase] ligase n=1 Tax=Falsiroseomonas sp. HW251 TaxID=3390998 RepID=UPI003D31EF4D